MRSRKRKEIKLCFLILFFSINFLTPSISTESTLEPFFSFNLMVQDSLAEYGEIVFNILKEELAKIGISIGAFQELNLSQISSRTWNYPGPYPIPDFENGGYDAVLLQWSWDYDWNPCELFDSPSINPTNVNFYQYYSDEMEVAIDNLEHSYQLESKLYWLKEIQEILYNDVPQLTLTYSPKTYFINSNFNTSNWNGIIWNKYYQSMENWSIPGQTEFHYAVPNLFQNFHIYTGRSFADLKWLSQIYTGLLELNNNSYSKYSPHIAKSITSTDGLTYNIELKPNIKWADGIPLNTSDIDFSYDLVLSNTLSSSNYRYWSFYITKESVQIIDADSCTITFRRKYAFQNEHLALDLIPKHIWKDIPHNEMLDQAREWALTNISKLIGAGPYKLANYNNITKIIHLTRNPYYANWADINPYFEDIYFEYFQTKEDVISALENDSIDMIDSAFSIDVEKMPSSTLYIQVANLEEQEIALNNYHPYFGTGEKCLIAGRDSANYIRKAINHAIPRNKIINQTKKSHIPGITPCPPHAIGYDKSLNPYEYNIQKAKDFMQLAGFIFPPKGEVHYISFTNGIILTISAFVLFGGHFMHKFQSRKEKSKNNKI